MSHVSMRVFLSALIVLFVTSIVPARAAQPLTLSCDDGRQFTITFVKAKGEQVPMKAHLVFKNSKTVEVLDNEMGASGCTYANEKYEFNEHQGTFRLTDYTKKGKNGSFPEIPCHKTTR